MKKFDKTKLMADLQEKHAKELEEARIKGLLIDALPEDPDNMGLRKMFIIYTHGFHHPLYGVALGLGFKVESRAEVGPIMALFPPDELELVYHGGEHDTEKSCYKGFWPASYPGKGREHVIKRVPLAAPFYYKLEGYEHGPSVKVHWNWRTTLDGVEYIVGINVEINGDPGRFREQVSRDGHGHIVERRTYPDEDTIPTGQKRGYYGNLRGDSFPWIIVYWPVMEGPASIIIDDNLRNDLRALSDAMLDVPEKPCESCGAEGTLYRELPHGEHSTSYKRLNLCYTCAVQHNLNSPAQSES